MLEKLPFALVAALLLAAGPEGADSPGAGAAGDPGTKANLDLPYDAAVPDEEEEPAPEIIVFYGQQYEGDGIIFCCDKSSSMEGAPWKRLQNEVVKNITEFSEKVQFAIIFFDTHVSSFPGSGRPAEAFPPVKTAAISMVMATNDIGHGSCYKPALIQALNYANLSTARRTVIICLGDGRTICGGQHEARYGAQTLLEVRQRNSRRIPINSICIGPGGAVNETWMHDLACQNGGSYTRIIEG